MFLALFLVFLLHTSSARQVEWGGNGEEVIVPGNYDELQLYADPRVPDFALIFPGKYKKMFLRCGVKSSALPLMSN